MYIKHETGQTYVDHGAIRRGVHAIFPDVITQEMLDFHGIVQVAEVTPVVGAGQIAEAEAPALIDGIWTEVWTVRDLTPEEIAASLPEAVPMLNLQLVLIDDGKLAAVQTILDSMAGDDGFRARAYWAKALTARRDNYLVAQLWPAIGYDEAGFLDAWARAAALNP